MDNSGQKYILMDYFTKYLKDIRKVSNTSVEHYKQALKYISRYLKEKGIIKESIYEIQDVEEIEKIKLFLDGDAAFLELDKRGHQMYSAGLNNYYRFASGEGFANLHEGIKVMDIEAPVPKLREHMVEVFGRSTIIKRQSIESANYECEISDEHKTFIVKNTNHQYMEAHHAIPMRYQRRFDVSLDVYANIVCLCPICHRLLHYGTDCEKEILLDKIYYERADRLATSGIKISRQDIADLL